MDQPFPMRIKTFLSHSTWSCKEVGIHSLPFAYHQKFLPKTRVHMLDAKLARESAWEDIIYIWTGKPSNLWISHMCPHQQFKGCKRPTRNEILSYIWCKVTFVSILVIYVEYYSGECKKTLGFSELTQYDITTFLTHILTSNSHLFKTHSTLNIDHLHFEMIVFYHTKFCSNFTSILST